MKGAPHQFDCNDLVHRVQPAQLYLLPERHIYSSRYTEKESKTGALITKPASKFTFTPATETVKTIPVYIQVSRQILEDAPALASEINDALRYDVQLAKEEQILFGNGVDPQLNGICPQAQTYDSTLPTQLGVTTPTRIDHLRAAFFSTRQLSWLC